MASAEVVTTKVIKLILNEDEACYLRDMLQNYISLDDEDETAYSESQRRKIFNALKETNL